jgi:hypothetical protein
MNTLSLGDSSVLPINHVHLSVALAVSGVFTHHDTK